MIQIKESFDLQHSTGWVISRLTSYYVFSEKNDKNKKELTLKKMCSVNWLMATLYFSMFSSVFMKYIFSLEIIFVIYNTYLAAHLLQ